MYKRQYVDEALVEKMRGVSRVTVYVGDDERENVLETLRIACEELREARRDVDFGTLAVSYTCLLYTSRCV